MRDKQNNKLGKRKQKRIIAKELGLDNTLEEIDRMNLKNLERLLENKLDKS